MLSSGGRGEVFMKQESFKMGFKQWTKRAGTQGWGEGVPQLQTCHDSERPATQGRESGAWEREDIVTGGSEGLGQGVRL